MVGVISKVYEIKNFDDLYGGIFEPVSKEEAVNELKEKLFDKYNEATEVRTAVDILLRMNE